MYVYQKLTSPSLALNAHLDATKNGDVALLRKAFASNSRFVGTDDTEVWSISKLTELLQSSNGEGWEMRLVSERNFIPVSLSAVSFLEFVNHKQFGPMRGSGVVIRDNSGEWRILDYILSFSVPNKVVDESIFIDLIKN